MLILFLSYAFCDFNIFNSFFKFCHIPYPHAPGSPIGFGFCEIRVLDMEMRISNTYIRVA
jgi:hypothetical protein